MNKTIGLINIKIILLGIFFSAALLIGLFSSGPKTASASALTPTATCSAEVTLNLNPGLWLLNQTSGTNQSFGETGTLDCSGTIDGYQIAGPGTVGFSATYTGTCAQVSGGGSWFFTLPIYKDGKIKSLHKSGAYNGPGVAGIIYFDGQFDGGRMTGTGAVTPVEGDCVTTPLTKGAYGFTGLQLAQ